MLNENDENTVQSLRIGDYLNWAGGRAEIPLMLPPIQRGFVWKPKQIQELWDSLIRGMPIGAVLVEKFTSEKSRLLMDSSGELKTMKYGWNLLDGQQRTLSMLLGFPTENIKNHKLWIDFNPHDLNNEALFQFRITTAHQPFGFQANGQRLSLNDRRKARKKAENFDSNITDKTTNEDLFKKVKPHKTKNQAYLFLVSELWSDFDILKIIEKIEENLVDDEAVTPDVKSRIKNFGVRLKGLKEQSIALIEVRKPKGDISNEEQNFLTLLFDRTSRNGTELSSEELLFSMIKQKWPEAHDLVFELHESVGTMMKPTDFIMTAYRLSATKFGVNIAGSKIKDTANPTIKDFYKNLPILLGEEDNPGELRNLISDGEFEKLFSSLKNAISYAGDNDIGLPEALLPYVERSLLQVLVYWCMHNRKNIKESREQLVQFVLFWMVASPSGGNASREKLKASEECFELIKENRKSNFCLFPLVPLIEKLTKSETGKFKSLLPELEMIGGDEFRDPVKRGQVFCGEEDEALYHNFTSRKILLLWFQREWVSKKFEGTEFLSGQDSDSVPYDFDHLVPQSNWASFQGRSGDFNQIDEACKKFNEIWPRRNLGNSIGNYRVMTSSDNRSRGDTPLMKEVEGLSFLTNKGDWKNYAFADDARNDLSNWKLASPSEGSGNWNNARVLAFQYAVEERVVYLYNKFISDSGLSLY